MGEVYPYLSFNKIPFNTLYAHDLLYFLFFFFLCEGVWQPLPPLPPWNFKRSDLMNEKMTKYRVWLQFRREMYCSDLKRAGELLELLKEPGSRVVE